MAAKAVLNVAEKPSMARQITQALAHAHTHTHVHTDNPGHGRGVPVHTFEYNLAGEGQVQMVFTSTVGHMKELEFASPYNEWSSCNPVDLFTAPVEWRTPGDNSAIERQLQTHARRAQLLVLWLDCDREGEGIAFEVLEACRAANPRLRVRRAKFSGVTARELEHALTHLVDPDQRMAHAVQARQELDLRLGAAFTRLQTLSLGSRFDELAGQMLSYGPCQFPTLGFVAERYEAIRLFRPERFWEIQVRYNPGGGGTAGGGQDDNDEDDNEPDGAEAAPAGGGGRGRRTSIRGRARYSVGRGGGRGGRAEAPSDGSVSFMWERERVFDQLTAAVLYESVVEVGVARVISITGNASSRRKPIPMNSVEMLAMANRFLRIPTQRAAQLAEQMYQKGFISYPRTETQAFETIDTRGLVAEQLGHPIWGDFARRLIDGGGYEAPGAGPGNDHAHPPIHPLKAATSAEEVGGSEAWSLYQLICRHFLACCSKDARGRSTHVTIAIGDERFTAHGTIVDERNFLDVYPYTKWTGKMLPTFVEGQEFVPSAALLREGSTQPPELLAEYDLVHIMEESGIGTDATFAEHIHKIQTRRYVDKLPNDRLTPTTLGWALIAGYNKLRLDAMSKPYLRAQVESDLTAICEGRKTKATVIMECLAAMRPVYDQVVRNLDVLMESLAEGLHPVGEQMAPAPAQAAYRGLPPAAGGGPPAPGPVPPAAVSRCGKCNGLLQLRRRDQREPGASSTRTETHFALFCTTCSQGFFLPTATVRVEGHDAVCPLCNFQVVTVHKTSSGGRGETYSQTLCPFCHSNPPPGYAANAARMDASGKQALPPAGLLMPCSKCSNLACKLAGGQQGRGATVDDRARSAAFPCGTAGCKGFMQLRRTKQGGFLLGCDSTAGGAASAARQGCPHTIWLPTACAAVAIAEGTSCTRCSDATRNLVVRKLDFAFHAGAVPPEMRSETVHVSAANVRFTYRACVVCSMDDFMEYGAKEVPARITSSARKRNIPAGSLPAISMAPSNSTAAAASSTIATSAHAAGAAGTGPTAQRDDLIAGFADEDLELLEALDLVDVTAIAGPARPAGPPAAVAPAAMTVIDVEDAAGGVLGGRYLTAVPGKKLVTAGKRTASGARVPAPASGPAAPRAAAVPSASAPRAPTFVAGGAPGAASGARGGRDLQPSICTVHNMPPVLRVAGPSSKTPGARMWVCPLRGGRDNPACPGMKFLGELDDAELREVEAIAATLQSGAAMPPAPAPSAAGSMGAGNCFKCQQPGHFARDCPTDGGAPAVAADRGRSAASSATRGGRGRSTSSSRTGTGTGRRGSNPFDDDVEDGRKGKRARSTTGSRGGRRGK